MYRKVLIPLDGTKDAEEVYSRIEGELAPGGEVVLGNVIPPGKTQVIGGQVLLGSQREEVERSRAESYLRGVLKRLGGDAERWSCQVVVADSVPQGIVELAKREGVELIAMYTHDRKGLARIIRGNNAREVQRTASTDVRVFTVSELEGEVPWEAPPRPGAEAVPAGRAEARAGGEAAAGAAAGDQLRGADLFKDLTGAQVRKVAALARPISVSSGEVLGAGTGTPLDVFVITEGEAELSFHAQVGEIPVRVAGPGDSFPLAALLGSSSLITKGRALTPMKLLALPCAALIDLCSKDKEIGMEVYRSAAQVFANRYSNTLTHLARTAERELRGGASAGS